MNTPKNLYEISVHKINGTDTSLSEYAGKVLLVVNVASKCGYTPQYDGLEKLYENYREKGLEVLGFPANDFLGQEPGSNEEIAQFCQVKFGVKFPMFQKVKVKGEQKHPMYRYLIEAKPIARNVSEKAGLRSKINSILRGFLSKNGEVSWNFEKFLVNRQGQVIDRFGPGVEPEDPMIIAAVEQALRI